MQRQRPQGEARGELVLLHGLEGSGEAGYMRGMAQAALVAGFATHRFNLRSCGGGERMSPTLYHAGLTSDLRVYVDRLEAEGRGPIFLTGYSLGGNVVLKYAGELGEDGPRRLAGVCALSVPIDLGACARRMRDRDNVIYHRRFVRHMHQRLVRTGRARLEDLRDCRSIYDIDERFTAREFGFESAEHYYRTQSAAAWLDRIRVPTLVVQSRDDSFIPFDIFAHPAFRENPCLELLATDHGGHLGYFSWEKPRFWADGVVLSWMERCLASHSSQDAR